MSVDVHNHTWNVPEHMDANFIEGLQDCRPGVKIDLSVDYDAFMRGMKPCARVICFEQTTGRASRRALFSRVACSYTER